MLAPRTDRLVQRIVGAGCAKFQTVALAKTGDRRLVQNHLGHRRQFDQIQFLSGALGCRIKAARAVQRIAEQIEPHRPQIARRIDVDDAAAHRVIAGFHHRRALHKPHAHQKMAQRFFVDPVAHTGRKRRLAQNVARRHPLGRGIQRGEQHKPLGHAVHQRGQRRHALRANVSVRRHAIIGQTIPSRKHDDRQIGGEKPQRFDHRGHAFVVARHVANRHATLVQLGQDQLGVKALGRA